MNFQLRFRPAARPAVLRGLLIVAMGFSGPARADILPPLQNIPFTEMTSPAGPASEAPGLVVGGGKTWLTWMEAPPGGVPAFRFSSWDGTSWSAPGTVAAYSDLLIDGADVPAFLVLSDGTLVAAWLRKMKGGVEASSVWVSVSRDGGATWAAPLCPHRDRAVAEHGFVSLAADAVEGFWVVWLDGRNASGVRTSSKGFAGQTELRAALWRQGSFGPEVVLDKRACECCQTAAVSTPEGVAVAYRDRSRDEIRDISLIQYLRRVWGAPIVLRTDGWKIAGCPVSGPAMACRDSLLAVAWFTDAHDKPMVNVALSDSAALGPVRVVNVDAGDPLGRVDVAWLPDESVLVSWVEKSGDAAEIRARRVTLKGEMNAPIVMAPTGVSRVAGVPHLAISGASVWMTWTDSSADARRVRIGRLDLTNWK